MKRGLARAGGSRLGCAALFGLAWLLGAGCGELVDGRLSIELVAGCQPSLAEMQQAIDMYCLSLESPAGQTQAGPNCSTSLVGVDLKVDESAAALVIVVEGFEKLPDGHHQVIVRGKSVALALVSGRDESVTVPLAPVGQFGLLAADRPGCPGLPFALEGHTASVYPSGLVLLVGSRRRDVPAGQAALLIDSHANAVTPLGTPDSLRRSGHVAPQLADGRVLFAGGELASSQAVTDELVVLRHGEALLEDYQADSDYASRIKFEVLARPMVAARARPAAAVFFDDQVLIDDGSSPAEMFMGATETSDAISISGGQAFPLNGNTVAPASYGDDRAILVGAPSRIGRLTVARGSREAIYQNYPLTTSTRDDPVIVSLPDSMVLILGGRVGSFTDGPVLVIDPGGGGQAPSLVAVSAPVDFPEHGHSATLLPDGRVLVVGGLTSTGQAAGAYLLVPTGGSDRYQVVAGPALNVPRTDHTASLLPDGRVLVVGGAQVGGEDPGRSIEVITF